MSDESRYTESSAAVQAHLSIAQSVIQRMATNSGSCKAWCITLVSAILVMVADSGKPNYALIAVIPAALFLVLDAYYLALERCFRTSYNDFIDRLHRGQIESSHLYAITPRGSVLRCFGNALFSFSIWPFYVTLIVMIWLVMRIVIPATTT